MTFLGFFYHRIKLMVCSTIYLDRIEVGKRRSSGQLSLPSSQFVIIASQLSFGLEYRLTGRSEMPKMRQVPQIELRVLPMHLTSDDRHNMQLDPNHIPAPTINDRFSSSFCLSTSMEPA